MDLISALPDCLLHLIMSFLTTKEAVQTCILSKRWKCLWTTLPFLNFTHDYGDDVERFISFVNTTLLLRETTDVQTFHLSCEDLPECYLNYMSIRSWILYVLKHNPKELDIEIPSMFELPTSVFTCSSLEGVSISDGQFSDDGQFSGVSISDGQFSDAGFIELPHLKRLCLSYTCLRQDFVEKLLCGCPLLESLELNCCTMEFSTLRSQSLKYLNVETGCDGEECMVRKTLELIEAPNLLSFNYGVCPKYFEHKTVLHTPSLTDATLRLGRPSSDQFNYHKTNLLVGISNVGYLHLSIPKEILEYELLGCPKFSNLKDLFVNELCLSCYFNLLASLIDHIPNLETLSLIHRRCRCEVSKEHGHRELLKISPFQCKQLKIVKILFYNNDEDFPRVMKYLRKSVLNLKVQILTSTF